MRARFRKRVAEEIERQIGEEGERKGEILTCPLRTHEMKILSIAGVSLQRPSVNCDAAVRKLYTV